MRTIRFNQSGQILVTLIISIPFLLLMISAYLSLSASSFRLARNDQTHTMAQLAADAGADFAVEQINTIENWSSTSGDVELHNDGAYKTAYNATVADDSPTAKTITITGKAWWPAAASTPNSTVVLKVGLRQVTSGNYSVASGEGGLVMKNSSKIAGGNVYVNGAITMFNSAQIGLSTSPVTVNVADQVCPVPADANYPRVCTGSDNQPGPITINNTAWIYGTVNANNQTSSSHISNPGLSSSSGVEVASLPTYDRAAQKAAVTSNLTGAVASCSGGSQTWPTNTKITGDVTISHSCKVTVQGNIWITGSLSVKNTAQLLVADSLGATRPVVMVDSASGAAFSNSAQLLPNASGTGFEVITFYANAPCSPDCISLTGINLYNSRSINTILLDNSASAPNGLFYAYWTAVDVKNSGAIGALIGQTVTLENNSTITFTTSTGAGTTSWVVNGYRRSF